MARTSGRFATTAALLLAATLALPQSAGAEPGPGAQPAGAGERGAAPTALQVAIDLPPEVLAIPGDRDYGEYLAAECTTCHQRDGGADGIPSITHWPVEHFVEALHAYRQGLRPNQVMQTVARRLGDEEIAALAAYFATIGD